MNIASLNPEFVFCDHMKQVCSSFLAELMKPVPFLLGANYVTLNGHLSLKRGHSLDSTCSHLAPNLVSKSTGNHHSWELNFPREAFPRNPVADQRGFRPPFHPPSLLLLSTKFVSKCWKWPFWRLKFSKLSRKLAPWHSLDPPPPWKLLDTKYHTPSISSALASLLLEYQESSQS